MRGKAGQTSTLCPLRVFRVYNKVADSGDVAIQEQRSSTFDRHELAIAMPLSPFCGHPMSHKNSS
jgi:hypothetical protein